MLAEYKPVIVQFRLEAVQNSAGKWNGQIYDAHSWLWTGAFYSQSDNPEDVQAFARRSGHNIVDFKTVPYVEPPAVTPKYPITYLEKAKPKVEDHLQSIGVGFAGSIKSDKEAAEASKKMERLRLVGAVIAGGSLFTCLGHLFPLLQAPANLAIILVSFFASLMGYFLMESASRSLRILQLLSRNKPLLQKFDELANLSPAVHAFRTTRQRQGRPLRTYDVAQANVIRNEELKEPA